MTESLPLQTTLHGWHAANGGRLVEFGGWSMPVQYGSIVEEHRAVRERVGLFDIGHMGRIAFEGPDVLGWLNFATTNDVARLVAGQIQYSLMVDDRGGVLDDILVYRLADDATGARYAMVCNASNRIKVLEALERSRSGFDAKLRDETETTGMIAVQGPLAAALVGRVFPDRDGSDLGAATWLSALKYYYCTTARSVAPLNVEASVSRTGYTGEDGLELIVPNEATEGLWTALLEAGRDLGVMPCGLGARDTLRCEAAMPLYGHEMDETVNPYSAGLGWAVKLNKGNFVGRDALKELKKRPGPVRVGLALEGKRIARQGAAVSLGSEPVGTVTSGTFSPTLGKSLAMARVDPTASAEGTAVTVDVRGHAEPAVVVSLPFYRRAGNLS